MEKSGTRRLHSFKEYKSIKTYLFLVFYPPTFIPFIKCVHTALHKFFFLQFSVKMKLRKIPVVSVDNALDKKIPFTPERVSVYLDFIHSLARPLGFCISTFRGRHERNGLVKTLYHGSCRNASCFVSAVIDMNFFLPLTSLCE